MANETILVVDDEADILELVKVTLEKEKYHVVCSASGEKALEIAVSQPPDIIVLDLMLPGIDGLDVTRKLKNNTATADIPIIMLTAKGEESDVITGLELGADDYVTKPFSPKVLNARIRSVLRRKQAGAGGIVDDTKAISMHGITITPTKHTVEADSKKINLTPSEFDILLLLLKHPGLVFTRWQIVDAIRGENYAVTDRSVDVQISGLRKKLGACGTCIETVRGVGYRLKE
ncbi:MAG: response regulator [Thermodesulfobacteriota bacterium]|nr:response regulator [Thermodesulfobacteriota bacterium]